ncbi:replicative DNA helicase [Ammoniphilus sp. YIM 78166]|uniref:replicative DNA helicase n=1 Tax=Ammoniphilus sp. YIM 78166 TaxID=1644106 RepID=UPI00107048C4|nr:replicative DNA helicase [Ammoniphilus sp. YIM 78166]
MVEINPVTNIPAEQYLLGCLLKQGELIKEVNLTQEQLHRPAHKTIFEAMKTIDERGELVDLGTVALELMDKDIGEITYLTDLEQSIPSIEPWRTYENAVIEAWKLRRTQKIAYEMLKMAEMDKDLSVITRGITALTKIDEVGQKRKFDLKELLMRIYEKANQDRGDLTGIHTGYHDLNEMTGGIQNQDLIILAARPSMGKTAFVLNLASNVADCGTMVDIFSLEMPEESLMNRMICSVGNIESSKMRNPNKMFSDDDWRKFTYAMSVINRFPLEINDDPRMTIQKMRSQLIPKRKQHPDLPMLVIVDYLQLMEGDGNGQNRVQEIGEISRGLKILARDLNCPIIALSQLSRAVEQRQDKRPMLSDLRESGQIEQDADLIAFLYRDEYYNKDTEEKNITELIVGKHRNGPTGTIKLAFLKEFNKFVNLTKTGD